MRVDPGLVRLAAALPSALAEARRGSEGAAPLVVSGPPSAAAELRRRLCEGGDASLVGTVGILDLERPEIAHGSAIVYLIRREPTPADEHALRRADRTGLPLLCLLLGADPADRRILPYVRATDVVRRPDVDDGAVAGLARRLAVRAPEEAWALAARLPALRSAVSRELVHGTARRNAALAAATFVPGSDLPLLSLAQLRMVLRITVAGGGAPEAAVPLGVAGAAAAGLAGRSLSRLLRRALPAALVNAAVAYAGTLAVGEAVAGRVRADRLLGSTRIPGAAARNG